MLSRVLFERPCGERENLNLKANYLTFMVIQGVSHRLIK
jgi:hypothetical protein